ncbi:hypothetical protein FLONG3_2101 [Fusarium longipes]|uniref:Uncharacterized protein n=1 Tax=Fusarium longipes TaxID=694270 RepID=A0A395T505_9HYPO|nr:hypothetical protein FLONG3_2101 [Fusarium longipes]
MQNYVRSRLNELEDEDLKRRLITEITNKSSGIFLWTYLAARVIRNKISYRANPQDLAQHLQDLPKGLEGLFLHVLQSLETRDAVRTLRLIDTIQTAKAHDKTVPALAYSFIEEYDRNPEFSMRENIEALKKDEALVKTQLRGTCGGLIEPTWVFVPRIQIVSNMNLDFIHRSLPDMFNEKTGSLQLINQMNAVRGDSSIIDLLSHISFAYTRLFVEDNHLACCRCESIILLRLKHRIDNPPYRFLDSITSWVRDKLLDHPERTRLMRLFITRTIPMSHHLPPSEDIDAFMDSFDNPLCIATQSDDTGYFEWKIRIKGRDLDSPVERKMRGRTIWYSKIAEEFLRHDECGCNRLSMYSLYGLSLQTSMLPSFLGYRPRMTWQCFIIPVIFQVSAGAVGTGSDGRTGSAVEMFVRQERDHHCQILITQEDQTASVTVLFKETQHTFTKRYGDLPQGFGFWTGEKNNIKHFFASLVKIINKCQDNRKRPPINWDQDFKEEFTLCEWVSLYDWPNLDTILDLMKE